MWIDIEQNTDEWFDLRIKKATSSNFAKIMANEGKSFGNPAIEYAQKIALEIVTGEKDDSQSFSNGYMERGHELEPVALIRYEVETFNNVTNGGFFHNDAETIGDSPDGLVGAKGCVEVKSVIPNTQWKRIKKTGIDPAYKWQIQGHLFVGEREWCDFISFCPEMPFKKQIHIHRVFRDEDMIERLKGRLKEFLEEVNKNVKLLKS